MLTGVFGLPGKGKSSLLTHIIMSLYRTEGRKLLSRSCERIEEINKEHGLDLVKPWKVPIYSDFRVKFLVDYEKYYEPYFVNGFYIGLSNDNLPVQYLVPGSKVFLSEVQRYFNSRDRRGLPDHVSRFFEMHRHYGLDVYMDMQRPQLLDLNIKDITERFIEVLGMEHKTDFSGRIISSKFICRAFFGWRDTERYLNNGEKTYQEIEIEHEGNIFRCFDSHTFADEFLPVKGKEFSYLDFRTNSEAMKIKPEERKFYKLVEPEGFRGCKKKE